MKRTNSGPIIDLTDETDPPKRNRPGDSHVIVIGGNNIAGHTNTNNNNFHIQVNNPPNLNNNFSNYNNFNNNNNSFINNTNNVTNPFPIINTGNPTPASSNINIHVRDPQKEAEANKEYFNNLLSFFTPVPIDAATNPFTNQPNVTPGHYTPPNLRNPKPPAPLTTFSISPPPSTSTFSLPSIQEFENTSIFSQKYTPTPPAHKPLSGSYSSLNPSTLFPLQDTTYDNNNNNNNNNNNINNNNNVINFFHTSPTNETNTTTNTTTNNDNDVTFIETKKKGKDSFMFHLYDPRKNAGDTKAALQRINNFLNNPQQLSNNNNDMNFNSSYRTNSDPAPVMIDLSNINDADDEEVYLGNLRLKLIGLQLYSGVVSKEENVSIVREPTDTEDPNSFAVYNILNVKVGNLEKHPASILAPLVDSSKLRIEGVIPVPKGDVLVQCYGKISDRDDVVSKLRALDLELGARLDKTELEKLQQNRVKVDKVNMQPDEMLSIPLSGDDLPLADPPAGLVSPLYPHQRQALSWMLEREKIRPSTLFWKKRGSNYFNSVTNSVVHTPPNDCRGGIIGDEMGLGKTLEIISLIIATKNAEMSTTTCSTTTTNNGETTTINGNLPNGNNNNNSTTTTINGSVASGGTTKSCSGPTMIVCPLSTLSNWSDQITKHCARNLLSVYLYHGSSRSTDVTLLSSYDIVVTTYNIVGLEFASNSRVPSPLYTILWKRVVLDEAHLIKNRTTQQTQAAWGLRAESKWCLTGTPIQNKIDDLYSLLRFIKLEPFTDFTWWTRLIARPIKNKDLAGYSRLKSILQHVILRRTKEKHIDLPPRTVYMQSLDFSVEERAYYDSLYRFGKAQFDQYARSGSVLQHYAHVLELLLRLRQTCNHPELVPSSTFSKHQPDLPPSLPPDRDVNDLLKTGELDECCICMDKALDPVATKCIHIFCKTCILQAISISGNSCPLCRAPVLPRELYTVTFNEAEEPIMTATNYKSSKIDALLLDLRAVRERDPTIKSIIFSQFTSFLDIIQQSLATQRINCVRLDGKMSHEQRQESMTKFETDSSISVFLLSLKAGGVGLNLVAASRVYMMDPWWNPAVEDQAIDRVHRLGQTRPVEVIRFVIKGTVEEKIMKLQQRKLEMAASALEAKSKAELQEMRLDDLNLLFS